MRVVVAMLVCLGLFGTGCLAHAEDAGVAYGAAFTNGSAIIGSGNGGNSLRSIIRDRGLALLAFLSRHVDASLNAERATALHFGADTALNANAGTRLEDDPSRSGISALRDSLTSVHASFALGGDTALAHGKHPIRVGVSANPKRVRLTAKVAF